MVVVALHSISCSASSVDGVLPTVGNIIRIIIIDSPPLPSSSLPSESFALMLLLLCRSCIECVRRCLGLLGTVLAVGEPKLFWLLCVLLLFTADADLDANAIICILVMSFSCSLGRNNNQPCDQFS